MIKARFSDVAQIFMVAGIFLGLSSAFCQNNSTRFEENLRFGGGIGLSFGDGFFSGSLAPSAIYEFNDQFAAGIGLNGTYASLKNNYTATILGGSVIALYNVIPEIQLSAEFEELNVNRNYKFGIEKLRESYWYPALFMGLGFHNNNVTIGIKYDVLYEKDESIYASAFIPFVRVYF